MDCALVTTADIELLATTFMIWSGMGVFFSLFLYDFICCFFAVMRRRFSSKTVDLKTP
ncbi:hypothetical protein VIS19158_15129, partial [Vibrio scophthalmi LMG 19158]